MTNSSGFRSRNQKPIRPDRVAIAVLVVLAMIIIPLAIRSGRTRPDDPIPVVSGDMPAVANGTTERPTEDPAEPSVPPIAGPERFRRHTVQDGETMEQIASSLGVTRAQLMASNRLLSSEQLRPGQTLYASADGIVHIIQAGQTLSDISKSYAVPLATLMEANNLRPESTIFAGDRILIPGVTSSFWSQAVTLSRGQSVRFIWPADGEVSDEFGARLHPVLGEWHHHDGIDIDVPEGTTVHASASGRVYFYGEQPGYGNLLILEHANGFFTLYGHLLRASVTAGQFVEMGQAVAQSGNTGVSAGPHLHFEIRQREYPVNPRLYLPGS